MAPKPSDMPLVASVATAELSEETTTETEAELFRTFTDQAVAPIGVPTSDGRMFAADIDLSFRSMPLPLQWCEQSKNGHDDSYTVGVIESMRVEGDLVLASGYILNTSHADDAFELVRHGVSNPSVDLASAEYIFTDKDGNELSEDEMWDIMWDGGEYFVTFTKAEVIATTLVSTPAFDTRFTLNDTREPREPALVASIVGEIDSLFTTYDPALFADPKLTAPTRPTMDKNTGRIFGHLAEWGRAYRGSDGRITAPRNHNGYANFHTAQVQLDNGKQLSVGRLTVQGGHAPTTVGVTAASARAHYDNACLAFGLVRVGEDQHGIWFSGVPAPGVDPEIFQQGMTSPLSGDWRNCGAGLDMIAAHAVNSPGFPIMGGATDANGRDVALVAAFVPRDPRRKGAQAAGISAEDLKTILTEVLDTVDERKSARLAAKVEADQAARRKAAVERARAKLPAQPSKLASAVDRAKAALGVKVVGGGADGQADPTTHPKVGKNLKPAGGVKVAK